MAGYDLGEAKGRIVIDPSGAVYGIGQATAATQGFNKSQAASAATLATTGKVMLGASAVIVGGLALAVKASADFEKGLSAVKAVGGLTADQLEVVRGKALQLGRDTAYGASEALGAMEELIKAGLSTEDVMNGAADATVALAAAGEVDLAEAASIAAAALNQFQLEAKDLPGVADTIAGAANASATGVSEIGLALSYVGPVAKAAGLTLEDTAAAVALLSNNGIDANKAGTALRAILSRLQPASKEAAGAMKELGLITEDGSNIFYDAEGNIKNMNEIVSILNGTFSELTAEQQAAYAKTIFGTEALAAVSAIAATTGEDFGELQAAIAAVDAEEVAAGRLDNLAGSFTILKGSIETMLIEAGTPLQAGLKGIVDALIGVVNWMANLNPEILKFMGYGAAGAAVVLALGGALLLGYTYVMKMRTAIAALNVALAANPAVLIVAGLIALAAALVYAYNNVEPFREAVDKAFSFIKDAVEPIIRSVIKWFENFAEQMQNLWDVIRSGDDVAQGVAEILDNILGNTGKLVPVIHSLVLWFQNLWTTAQTLWTQLLNGRSIMEFLRDIFSQVSMVITTQILPVFASLVSFMSGTLIPIITALAAGFLNAFQVVLGTVIPFAIGLVTQLVTWFQTMLPQIIEAVTHVFNFVKGFITVAMGVVLAIIRQVINVISALWRAWGDDLTNMVGTVWTLIKTTIESAIKIVQGIIQTVLALINGDWGKAWDGIKQVLAGAWDFMVGVVKAAVGLFKGVITGFVSTLIQIWNGLWEKLKGLLSSAWNAIVGLVTGYISTMIGLYIGLPGKITGAIGDLLGILKSFFVAAWDATIGGVIAKVGELSSYLGGLPGIITGAIGDLGGILLGAGKDIIRGLIRGVESMIGSLKDKLGSITDLIPDIKGPPEKDKVLLVENGQLIMQGLINGLDKGYGKVRDYLQGVTATIPTEFGVNGQITNAVASSARGLIGPSSAPVSGPSFSIGKVEIPARDLEEMRTVQDFFDRIQQVARQGVGV